MCINPLFSPQGSIAALSTKLRLLDASQLDQIEGRLSALSHRLTQVAESKDKVENQDKLTKVRGQINAYNGRNIISNLSILIPAPYDL